MSSIGVYSGQWDEQDNACFRRLGENAATCVEFGSKLNDLYNLLASKDLKEAHKVSRAYVQLKKMREESSKALNSYELELNALQAKYSYAIYDPKITALCVRDKIFLSYLGKYHRLAPLSNDYFYRALVSERRVSCTTLFASCFIAYDFHEEYRKSHEQNPDQRDLAYVSLDLLRAMATSWHPWRKEGMKV